MTFCSIALWEEAFQVKKCVWKRLTWADGALIIFLIKWIYRSEHSKVDVFTWHLRKNLFKSIYSQMKALSCMWTCMRDAWSCAGTNVINGERAAAVVGRGGGDCLGVGRDDGCGLHGRRWCAAPAHISMNASLSRYLYIMATTPRRGQASSRLISPLTARPKEKWGARQRCSLLIHRLYLTPLPRIARRTLCGFSYLFIDVSVKRYALQGLALFFIW